MIGYGNTLMQEVTACHEAFHRLGFRPEDVYVLPSVRIVQDPEGGEYVAVQLQAQGLVYTITVAKREGTVEAFMEEWQAHLAGIRSIPEAEMQAAWERSHVRQNAVAFAASLLAKGFTIPKHAAAMLN